MQTNDYDGALGGSAQSIMTADMYVDLADTPLAHPDDLTGEESGIKPSVVQRIPASTGSDKKCFVKVVAIGDSGVGKTSLI